MDGIIGRMLKKVDDPGLGDNTLVLFFGDNGTLDSITTKLESPGRAVDFQGGKGDTAEAGMRVPLIARWKGRIPVGRVCGDLIDSCDFLPTIRAAARVSPKSMGRIYGHSFLPQLHGQKGQSRDWIYSWYDPRPGHDKERWTKTNRYALAIVAAWNSS